METIDLLFVHILHSDKSGWNVAGINLALPGIIGVLDRLSTVHVARILERMQKICTDRDFDKASPFKAEFITALEASLAEKKK
jgi:hypothetical protein